MYGVFIGVVLFMLILDLGVFHRKAHVVSLKEASVWTGVWISLALLFNYGLYVYANWNFSNHPELLAATGKTAQELAQQVGLEFLTGYVIEKSLAVDNIFVFVIVFSFFAIPNKYQHRVLFYGILGALIFRAIFIAIGSILMQYHWVIMVFGGFLLFTGFKMLFTSNEAMNIEQNFLIRLARRYLPITTTLHEDKFFVHDKKWLATPLFLALIFLEMSDVIFALDSIPAIFAITKEPFIVFTSNIFAILGLRSMYFLLAGVLHMFHYLKYGLALVLMFVGIKMVWLNQLFGGQFPITWSLGIILGIITLSIIISLLRPPPLRQ